MRRRSAALVALSASAIFRLPEARFREAGTAPPQADRHAPFARLAGGQGRPGERYQESGWGVGQPFLPPGP